MKRHSAIRVLQSQSQSQQQSQQQQQDQPPPPVDSGSSHACRVTGLAISADGKWVLSGDESGLVNLWDSQQGIPVSTFESY